MSNRSIGYGHTLCIAIALFATGCMPQLKRNDFAHDRALFAYFNERADSTFPSAGALVADNRILWEAPATARGCVRKALFDNKISNRYRADIPQLVKDCSATPDQSLVVAGISGGGHKSEVFALSVMEELETHYDLLDDVDAIASASGGSFAALIYALSCDAKACKDHESWRLKWDPTSPNNEIADLKIRNLLWSFIFTRLRPDHLFMNATLYHDSGESFYDVLRSDMFEKHPDSTFADLNVDRPNLILTATNLTRNREGLMPLIAHDQTEKESPSFEVIQRNTAQHFSFTQAYFDQLGSKLENYSVLKALVASAAFPLIIDPTTVRDYTDPPDPDSDPRCLNKAPNNDKRWYPNSDCESFVHLTDGGVHDNVAVSELQWYVECLFAEKLKTRLRAGTLQPYCKDVRATGQARPKVVLSIVVDASLSASEGRDNQKAEQRLASWGIPIRIGSTSDIVDMMSFSNTTQRKAELAVLSQELSGGGTRAAFADFGLETINDLDCIEHHRCTSWQEVREFAAKHGRMLQLNGTIQDTIKDLLARVREVDVSFELSDSDRQALADAAPWIVARRVLQLCDDGVVKAMALPRAQEARICTP